MIVSLSDMENEQEADLFAQLTEKELLFTKENKPYLKVAFRDAHREVKFPIWSDVAIYKEFKALKAGMFCKLRALYRVTAYGPQLEIRRIREVNDEDVKDGFDAVQLRLKAPRLSDAMYDELLRIAAKQIGKGALCNIITKIFKDHRDNLLLCPAARNHHHTYLGGLLEHTLSVTKIATALVDHYQTQYKELKKEISRPLVIAGAILHDIGKVLEYTSDFTPPRHSVEGELIGHAILSRDLVRDAAKEFELDKNTQMHLEHILISHQRFPDWGAAKPPMSMEAMLVHHADSCDALVGCLRNAFSQDRTEQELTGKKNAIGYPLLKPPGELKEPEV